MNLEKNLEYTGLLLKIESLQKKFKAFAYNIQKDSQKTMNSKQKIEESNLNQLYETNNSEQG